MMLQVDKGQPYDIFTIQGKYYKINDIKTFYQDFLKNRQDYHCALQYTNNSLKSGFTIDCDLYVPADNNFDPTDLQQDRENIYQLAEQIQQIFKKYLVQNQTYQEIPYKYLDFVILERHGPNKSKTFTDPSLQRYVRFGFHIYFNKIKTTQDYKKQLAQILRTELQSTYNELHDKRYKTTNYNDFLDTNPFYGTTSLPLTWNDSSKRYSFMVEKINNKIQQIDFHDLQRLDPFNGIDVILNPQLVQNIKIQNIITFMQQKVPANYEQSLILVYNQLIRKIKNQQLINLLIQFGHVQWQQREYFATNLYYYLNRNQYLTEMAYYIAMAENMQEIIEQQTFLLQEYQNSLQQNQDITITLQWMNSTQDRYPYKVSQFIDKISKNAGQQKDSQYLIKKLIRSYNKNLQIQQTELQQNLDKESMQETNGIYDEFLTWKNVKWNGILANTKIESIKPQRFKALFQNYIYIKLAKTLRSFRETVKDDQQIYEFNDSNQTDHDQYHYIYVNSTDIESKIKQYYKEFQEDYSYIQTQKEQLQENVMEDPLNEVNSADFLLDLLALEDKVSTRDYQNCLSYLQFQKFGLPDQDNLVFGVYNGVLKYDSFNNKFKFLQGDDACQYFITRSTMFNVPDWLVDENGYLLDIDQFSTSDDPSIKQIYDAYIDIKQIYDEIFMDKIEVFQWKLTQIVLHLIYKNMTNQCIFVTQCTGSGGKTCQGLPIQVWLGQNEQEKTDPNTGQKRKITLGYTGQPKASILQTADRNSASHDTGGMNELYGTAYCMLSELSSAPIVNAQVKNLCGDTQVGSREIYGKSLRRFQNKAFIELQTNDPLHFEGQYDYGTQRRIFPFTFTKKFVDQKTYDSYKGEDRDILYGVKKEGLIEKLCNDFNYIDAGNIYILKTFLEFPYKNKSYIPQPIIQEQKQLFSTFNPWLQPFIGSYLQEDNDGGFVLYETFIKALRNYIKEKDPTIKDSQLQSTMRDYEYLTKEYFIAKLYFRYNNGELEKININKFDQYIPKQDQGQIIITQYVFSDESYQKKMMEKVK